MLARRINIRGCKGYFGLKVKPPRALPPDSAVRAAENQRGYRETKNYLKYTGGRYISPIFLVWLLLFKWNKNGLRINYRRFKEIEAPPKVGIVL